MKGEMINTDRSTGKESSQGEGISASSQPPAGDQHATTATITAGRTRDDEVVAVLAGSGDGGESQRRPAEVRDGGTTVAAAAEESDTPAETRPERPEAREQSLDRNDLVISGENNGMASAAMLSPSLFRRTGRQCGARSTFLHGTNTVIGGQEERTATLSTSPFATPGILAEGPATNQDDSIPPRPLSTEDIIDIIDIALDIIDDDDEEDRILIDSIHDGGMYLT